MAAKNRRKVLLVQTPELAVHMFFWGLAVASIPAPAQVNVSVPAEQYSAYELIDVTIENQTKAPISFCVEFGHWSFRGEGNDHQMETTPTPVFVQVKAKRGWSTLLIGPDIGSIRQPVTLAAGESQHWPFRLSDRGQMRIVLDYWKGENGNVCSSPKGRKTVISRLFWVR